MILNNFVSHKTTIIMKIRNLFWFLIIPVICSTARCKSSALSREDAKQKIIEFYHFPYVTSELMYVVAFRNKVSYKIKNLLQQDLVAFNGWEDYEKNLIYYSPTEKGKQFLMSDNWAAEGNPYGRKLDYITNCVSFNSISRITVQGNTTTVEYTCKRIGCTPFGILKGYSDGDLESKTATFQKYDDGWKLIDNAPAFVTPSKLSFFTETGEYKDIVQESSIVNNTNSESEEVVIEGILNEVILQTSTETLYNISGTTVECSNKTKLENLGTATVDDLPIGATFKVIGIHGEGEEYEKIIANKLIKL